jgi:hypothetical protein
VPLAKAIHALDDCFLVSLRKDLAFELIGVSGKSLRESEFKFPLALPCKCKASFLDDRVNRHDIIPNRASANALLKAHGVERGGAWNEV